MAAVCDASIPAAPEKVRHEWYQTDQAVIVTVLVKGLPKERIKVSSTERKLVVEMLFANEERRTVELQLLRPVVADMTTVKYTSSKVEVNLKKTEAVRWETLEAPSDERSNEIRPTYPSSAKTKHDWDALLQEVKKEEAEEKPEGDAALQKLFSDIYANASDDTKRAMNKSYMESGGTVLSTNWEEIKKERVQVRPPDGMEFKKWDQ